MDTDVMEQGDQVEILRRTTNMLIKHVRMVNEQHDLLVDQKRTWIQEYENLVNDYDSLKNNTVTNQASDTNRQKITDSHRTCNFRSIHEDIEYLEREYERQLAFKRMIRKKVFENEDLEKTLTALTSSNGVKLDELNKLRINTDAFDKKLALLTDRLINSCYNFNGLIDDSFEKDLDNKKTPTRQNEKLDVSYNSKSKSEVIAEANKEFINCLNVFKRDIQHQQSKMADSHNDFITQRDLSSIGNCEKEGFSPNKTDRIREKIEEALRCSQRVTQETNPLLNYNMCLSNKVPRINTDNSPAQFDKKYNFKTHRPAEKKDKHDSIFKTPGINNNQKCRTPEKNIRFSPSPIVSQIDDASSQNIGDTVKKYSTMHRIDDHFVYESPKAYSNIINDKLKVRDSQNSGLNSKISKMLNEYDQNQSKTNYEIIVQLNTIDKLNLDMATVSKSCQMLQEENERLQSMLNLNPPECSLREDSNENKDSVNNQNYYIENADNQKVGFNLSIPLLPPSGKHINTAYNTQISTNVNSNAEVTSNLSFDKKIHLLKEEKKILISEKDSLLCENSLLYKKHEEVTQELDEATQNIMNLNDKIQRLEVNNDNQKQVKGHAINEVKCLIEHNEQLEKTIVYYEEKPKSGYSSNEYRSKNDELQKNVALYATLQLNNEIIKKESEDLKEALEQLKFENTKIRTSYINKIKKTSLSFQIDKRKLEHELLELKIDLDKDLPEEIVEGLNYEKDKIHEKTVELCLKLDAVIKECEEDSDVLSSDYGQTVTDRVLQLPQTTTDTDRMNLQTEKMDNNNILKTNLTDNTREGPTDTNVSMDRDSTLRKSQKENISRSIYNQDTLNKTQEISYNNSTNVHTITDDKKIFDTVSHNSSYNNDSYCEDKESQKIKELKKLNYKLKENLIDCQALLAEKENEARGFEQKFDKIQKNMSIRQNNKQKSVVELTAKNDILSKTVEELEEEFSNLTQSLENKSLEFENAVNEVEKLRAKSTDNEPENELQNQLNNAQKPFLKSNNNGATCNYETEEDLFVLTEEYVPSEPNVNCNRDTMSSNELRSAKSHTDMKKKDNTQYSDDKSIDKKTPKDSLIYSRKQSSSSQENEFCVERVKYLEKKLVEIKFKYEADRKVFAKIEEENKMLQSSLQEMTKKTNVLQEVDTNTKKKLGGLFYELLNQGKTNHKKKKHELIKQKNEAESIEKNLELHSNKISKVMKEFKK